MPAVTVTPEGVTVVVPVYGALNATLACVHSVLTSARTTDLHLVVIDDCSPDAEVSAALEAASQGGLLFSLWRNESNRGFVHTANRGLLAARGDVVLLNSDTLVTDHWLDRMVAVARADPCVASVSPMSNNATILSYPVSNRNNDLPEGVTLAELAVMFAHNRERLSPVEVPVTVGFCMLMTRAAIEATGGFDEGLFGIGYGEESDWCMRAATEGFRHVVAVDAFVYHVGETSFSDKSARRQQLAGLALTQRHPGYWPAVGDFCTADPLQPARRLVDVLRLHRAARGFAGIVVHVLHALGGGTLVHAEHLADLLAAQGYGSIFVTPNPLGWLAIAARFVDVPNLVFDCLHDLDVLHEVLGGLDIARVHVHALIGFCPEAAAAVAQFEPALTVTLHDYFPLCPQITLLDHTGHFCDLPAPTHCNRCLARRPPPIPADSIEIWRRDWAKLLRRADRLIAPSDYVARMFRRVHPDLAIEVVQHNEAPAFAPRPAPRESTRPGPRRVAVLGNLNHHKGVEVVAACAALARDVDQPLQFVLFGAPGGLDAAAYGGKLRTTGPYKRADLPDLIAEAECHIGFLPSIWPETYSFVLSEMLSLGLHPVVFDLGAQADRLRELGTGTILPAELGPAGINARLLELEIDLPRGEPQRESGGAVAAADYLQRLYGTSFRLAEPRRPADERLRPRSASR